MKAAKQRIYLLFSLIVCLAACQEDDGDEATTALNATMDGVRVAVVQSTDEGLPTVSAVVDILTQSGASSLATLTLEPVVVPIDYAELNGDPSASLLVRVEVAEDFAEQVATVELDVVVGGEEDEDPLTLSLETDALEQGVFFARVKPGCGSGTRSDSGECVLSSVTNCETAAGVVQGRCDTFSVRLLAQAEE